MNKYQGVFHDNTDHKRSFNDYYCSYFATFGDVFAGGIDKTFLA